MAKKQSGPPPIDFSKIGSGGSSSSGSSGGGGGGRASSRDLAQSQVLQQATSLYVGLWGESPVGGYIEGLLKRGLNLSEIEAHERAKPAFKYSPRYAEERFSAGSSLAGLFGSLG